MAALLSTISQIHKTLQNLSFDVVVATACSFIFVSYVTDSFHSLKIHHGAILLISVWCLYTIDHFLDIRSRPAYFKDRHRIHAEYKRNIRLSLVIGLILLSLLSLIYLPSRVYISGILLFLLALLHLLSVQKFKWYPKEIVASVLYTIGIWFFAYHLSNWKPFFFIYFIIHCSVILLNMLCYNLYDYRIDARNKSSGLLCLYNTRKIIKLCHAISILSIVCYCILCIVKEGVIFYMSLVMLAIVPIVIIHNYRYLHKNERYRLFGDYAFALLLIDLLISS